MEWWETVESSRCFWNKKATIDLIYQEMIVESIQGFIDFVLKLKVKFIVVCSTSPHNLHHYNTIQLQNHTTKP